MKTFGHADLRATWRPDKQKSAPQLGNAVLDHNYGSCSSCLMAVLLLASLWFYNTGANSSTAISSLSGGHLTPDNSQEASVMDAKYLS